MSASRSRQSANARSNRNSSGPIRAARPPRIARTRSAVAYDELSRSLAIRLKYGRKVAIARTMARYMAPLIQALDGELILMPVPLHRTRLWRRGFNQSALVARELSRRLN